MTAVLVPWTRRGIFDVFGHGSRHRISLAGCRYAGRYLTPVPQRHRRLFVCSPSCNTQSEQQPIAASSGLPRLRFAPSPTGHLHLGGLRTALLNHLFARNTGGLWILRIEDTDRSRFHPGAVEALQETLQWAGLHYDEGPDRGGSFGPYVQSERLLIYRSYVDRLLGSGAAYRDFRSQAVREDVPIANLARSEYLPPDEAEATRLIGHGQPFVVRLRTHPEDLEHHDLVYGTLRFPADHGAEDPILLKSDGWPTYHLASVVDDHEMRITHVFRGEEWIPSLPRHLLLYRALGIRPPAFAHLPLLMNPDGSKLSKRSGDVAVEQFREKGYEAEALINFVALMGYNHHGATTVPASAETPAGAGSGEAREVMSMEQLIAQFEIGRISHTRATMDLTKLHYLNKHHLHRQFDSAEDTEVLSRLRPLMQARFPTLPESAWTDLELRRVARLVQERADVITALPEAASFLYEAPDMANEKARSFRKGIPDEEYVSVLNLLREQLASHGGCLDAADADAVVKKLVGKIAQAQAPQSTKSKGWAKGVVMKSVRHALTGGRPGPTIPDILAALGPAVVVERLERARSIETN